MNQTFINTLKFVVRLALLIGTPLLVAQVANLTGNWKTIFDTILPVMLPIIDKWVHEDDRINAKGIVPF